MGSLAFAVSDEWQIATSRRSWAAVALALALALGVIFVAEMVVRGRWWRTAPRPFVSEVASPDVGPITAKVESRSWQYKHQRFSLPSHCPRRIRRSQPDDAFEVKSLGPGVHHHEQVEVGTHPETYSVRVSDGTTSEPYTERIQDGYETRTMMERVACGEDCVAKPQVCTRSCKPNSNGFLHQQLYRRGTSCTRRYCSHAKTT